MLDWLREHFAITYWPALFDKAGDFTLIRISGDWLLTGDYRHASVTIGLLGLNVCFTVYPDGYAEPEEVADLMQNAIVQMSWDCYQDMKRDQDELRRIKGEAGAD